MTARPAAAPQSELHLERAVRALEWLRGRSGEQRELLEAWAAIESPSREPATQEPLLRSIAAELEKIRFEPRLLPGRPAGGLLYARPRVRRRRAPRQLLIGHCDTVWPLDTLETMPIRERRGRIRGPGVYDMKAGLVQLVFALRAFDHFDWPLPVMPIVLVNSDEEIGSRGSTAVIRRLARIAARAFVLEPSLGLEGRLKTARKGVGRFEIGVRGQAAHAGLDPEAGVSAILELSHVIQTLFAMNDVESGVTVNVGTIEGGLGANVIAPESRAVVDVRVLREEDARRIEREIRGLRAATPGAELVIEGGIGRPPMERTPANAALFAEARRIGEHLGFALEEATAGGGSDGNTTSLYTATLDGLGAVGDGAHAPHEFLFTERLPERTALLVGLLGAPVPPEPPA